MPKAVFLDRDGTIIDDRGHLRDASQVVFYPEAFEALRRLQDEFLLFIVTNQSGVAQGAITRQDADNVNRHVVERLAREGIRITDVYVCPHSRQDGCACIKPKPHFLRKAEAEHRIDLTRSFTVGDHPHDVELARGVDAQGIYVLTGHGEKHLAELAPDRTVAGGIGQASERILTLAGFAAARARAGDDLRRAAAVLRQGGTVALPTETVYGLGANALDAAAVARIFALKQRPRFDPLIVHVASMAQAHQVVGDWPEAAAELARRFWPGPLTLVLPRSDAVPDIVTSGLPTVGLRMPDHPLALALIDQAGVPVAAPSANRFGSISPTTTEHVRMQLGDTVDVVLEGGACRVGVESTIVALTDDGPVLLRAGGTPVEEIERVVGPVKPAGSSPRRPTSPGQCLRHYASRTPLTLCNDASDLPALPATGLLTLRPVPGQERFAAVEVLSPEGDLQEAACGLFAALYRLDARGLDSIVALKMPDAGLGRAINDRLRRAAHQPDEVTVRESS